MLLPSTIFEGVAPKIMVAIQGVAAQMLLDSGAELSVLPLTLAKAFTPPIEIPFSIREARTFGGTDTVALNGPVYLQVCLCGMKFVHPFYLTEANSPLIGGYDLMKAARLVVDVDNALVWSRRAQPLDSSHPTPNPSVPVRNTSVYSGVTLVQPDQQHRVAERRPAASGFETPDTKTSRLASRTRHRRARARNSPASSSNGLDIETYSQHLMTLAPPAIPTAQGHVDTGGRAMYVTSGRASTRVSPATQGTDSVASISQPTLTAAPANCHMIEVPGLATLRVVLKPNASSGLRDPAFKTQCLQPNSAASEPIVAHSTLDPRVPPFRPRARTSSLDAPHPGVDASLHPPSHVSLCSSSDGTVLKTPLPAVDVLSSPATTEPSEIVVPEHLQELFQSTLECVELSPDNQQRLATVLQRNSDTFAKNSMDLGYCTVLEHDIDTADSKPIKQPPRRPPLSARDAEDAIIDEMLQTGVIEPSNSPWSSPVCMVKKKDETYRFCVDYRRLNDITRKDAFPVPDVKDALDSLRGAKFFATIDLLSGYWQLRQSERAKERSAFCTRRGLFCFTRMPFGLSNAPSTFCRLMHIILADLLYIQCLCYLDDIIVFADTQEELLERLDNVLTRLRQHGLKAKPSKCVLFKTPIEFLGHLVSADGIEPQPEKLAAIRDWPTPHCLRDVRAFYGLCSYYRRFVRNFADVAEPLSKLTKKGVPFQWTDETQTAFERLKTALLETDTLAYPHPDLPCILDTDASDVAVGAVLSQVVNGVEKPIAFFSRVLNGAQRNYCPTRRELLAAVLSLQHFRHYLLGARVILRTDHHSLKWLKTFKRPEGILARWIETLAEYDYEIEHRPGRLHSNADAISRQTCKQCWGRVAPTTWIDECERAEELVGPLSVHTLELMPELSLSDLACLQAEDSELGEAYRVLDEGLDPSSDELRSFPLESRFVLSLRPEVYLQDGVMVRSHDNTTRLVVPVDIRRRLFDLAHAGPTAAHLGAVRIIKQLKSKYYWPGLNRDVRQWYKQCVLCAKSKGPPTRPHGRLQKIRVGAPLDLVTMDILSGLPTATDGSKYILVLVDAFTKWVETFPLPDQEASTCITAAYNGFFARFGLPRQLHSDQGRNFEAALVKELCYLSGVYKTRTTPFHPRSDGLTERANRTILQMLRSTTQQHPHDWPARLPSLLAAYRMTTHSTTGFTPNRVMLGREVAFPCTLIAAPPHDQSLTTNFVTDFRDTMRESHQRVRESLKAHARTEKRYFDNRVKPVNLAIGQLVWLYWPRPLIRKTKRKLTSLWSGPWTIRRFHSPIVVEICHTETRRKQVVHVDRLVACDIQAECESRSAAQLSTEHQKDGDAGVNPVSLPLSIRSRTGRTVRRPARYC